MIAAVILNPYYQEINDIIKILKEAFPNNDKIKNLKEVKFKTNYFEYCFTVKNIPETMAIVTDLLLDNIKNILRLANDPYQKGKIYTLWKKLFG